MDRIKDAGVLRLIEQIGEHYRTNISNRFLRPILLTIPLDKTTWDQVELLTEKIEIFQYQGFHFDELYTQIVACARFVDAARSNLLPTLRNKISSIPGSQDKTLREMAASNFVSNLQVFADLLFELYSNLIELDKQTSGKNKPVYTQVQDLSNVLRLRV